MKISYTLVVYILIAALSAFRIFYIIGGFYALAPDETYFWEWSRHLDWSYYDMGPMVAYIIAFTTKIFGATELGVRLGAVILSAGVSLAIFYLAREMFGSSKVGLTAVILMNIVPIGATGSIIMTYYSPQVFFWALSLFFIHRAISTGKAVWWYPLGISLGLGLLSHHLFFVLSAQLLLYLVLSQEGRPWLRRREPYLAAIIALDMFLPVLLWNIEHEMVMFRHATGLMGRDRSVLLVFSEFLGGQLGVVSPLMFLASIYAMILSAHRGFWKGDDRWLFLFTTSVPVLVFISCLSFGRRVEANWPVSAYVSGLIAVSAIFHLREEKKSWQTWIAAISVVIALCETSVAHFPSLLDTFYSLPPRLDTTNRLFGWKELGKRISEIRKEMPVSFLSSRDYGISSEIAFYTEGQPHTYCLTVGRKRNQYDLFEDINALKGRDSIYVKFGPAQLEPKVQSLFESVSPPEDLVIYKQGRSPTVIRRVFTIFRLYGFKGIPRGEELNTY